MDNDTGNNNEKPKKTVSKKPKKTVSKKPKKTVSKKPKKTVSKKPKKKRSKKELVFDDKKYLEELNNIKMSLARLKSIQKKLEKKSSKKSSKKLDQFVESDKIIKEIEKIEKNDENYKVKFDELKDAYIKKHNILINVFDGYQKLYRKMPN